MTSVSHGFAVEVGQTRGGPLLRISGEIDLLTAARFEHALSALVAAGEEHVLIDLSSVTFIDSTGMAALVHAQRRGLHVHVIASSPSADLVLELSGLKDLMS